MNKITIKRALITMMLLMLVFTALAYCWYEFANLRQRAEGGVAEAQNNLGKIYYFAGGVKQDYYHEAAQWYRRAAEQGHADDLSPIKVAKTVEGFPYNLFKRRSQNERQAF